MRIIRSYNIVLSDAFPTQGIAGKFIEFGELIVIRQTWDSL